MLSIERARELIGDPSLSDKEVEEIRDSIQRLVEVIYAKWEEDRKAGRLGENDSDEEVTTKDS